MLVCFDDTEYDLFVDRLEPQLLAQEMIMIY